MADETASEVTEQATTTETTATPASLVGADGALVKDWQKQAPEGYEDLREDKTLATVKNIWDFGKSHVHMRKQVPVDKMARPNDKWGDDDWNEFYKAAGRPETAADYGVKRNEKIPEEAMTDDMIGGFQDLFHKIGLNKKQVDAIVEYNDGLTLTQIDKMTGADKDRHNVMMDSLYKEFGQATEQRTRWSNGAIERGVKGSEELRAFITEKMNTENDIVPWSVFLSNIESNFAEHGEFADPTIETPKAIQAQIADIIADPKYSHTDIKVRQPLIDKVQRLYKQLNKGAVVGQATQQ